MSHDLLHSRPEKFNVTKEIKDYINTCIRQNVPEIYQLIKDQHIKGYESLTIKQEHAFAFVTVFLDILPLGNLIDFM
ncbi:30616_t:CDS:2, partial [Racocetra persica]